MAVLFPYATHGQDISLQPQDDKQRQAKSLPNIKVPTLGGKQFWTDHAWRRGWKIQQNVLTSHWRLIDDRNVRHAWGGREACERELDERVSVAKSASSHLVLLLHGLMRSSDSMDSLAESLQASTDFGVVTFEYASTRASITDHALALRDVVASLPEDVELSFVGHSLGNIVIRHAIGDWQRGDAGKTLARIKHVVMLGPPNQGASIARQLSKVRIFEWITGESGMELGPQWKAFESRLATPHCPFGIIAGNLPGKLPDNPLVDGSGDFVVSVEETRLDGSRDFLEVPRLHSFLMDDPVVQKAVASFLKTERF